jgi:hypothetical protein
MSSCPIGISGWKSPTVDRRVLGNSDHREDIPENMTSHEFNLSCFIFRKLLCISFLFL